MVFVLFFMIFGNATNQELPTCYDSKQILENIETNLRRFKNSPQKYAEYQRLLIKESDKTILYRLIYAETKAAQCPHLEKAVAQTIAHVIQQRIFRRGNDIQSVVFQKDQFSSSLNIYAGSYYKDFLCPKDIKLWQLVQDLHGLSQTTRDDVLNYFLYQHHPHWKKEPWTLKEHQRPEDPKELSRCIRAFHNPSWR